MANVYLICEGPSDGLDVRVLDKLIAQKLGVTVQISPAGGDRGLRSVAVYLEEQSKQRFGGKQISDQIFTIEDRNYSPWQKAVDSWDTGSKRLIWRRHEIENYLLAPGVVTTAFGLLCQANASLSTVLPQNSTDTERLLQALAEPMLEDHAGWLTHYRLLETLNPLALNLSGLGGALGSRQTWLAHLRQECARLNRSGADLAVLPALTQPEVEKYYDQQLTQLKQPAFLASGQYLIDLRGKELLQKLLQWVRQQALPTLRAADFQAKLIDALEQEYQPGYFAPDDFNELAARLK